MEGKAAGLVLPFCNTDTMNLHLAEISLAVTTGAHAVLLMDQAGWHTTGKLEVPGNITIVTLPSRSPELNPQENIWQYMRDNWLIWGCAILNRLFPIIFSLLMLDPWMSPLA
jgi:transposase